MENKGSRFSGICDVRWDSDKKSWVAYPRDETELRSIVLMAIDTSTALVPIGGDTGLVGGTKCDSSSLGVAMSKMDQILNFSAITRSITVQAGAITENVQNFVANHDLYFPLDLASRGSSQIGGNVSTCAGGTRFIKYGSIRNWVLGLKVIDGRGQIHALNHGLEKCVAGYDLKHLFIGSEGTLGLISEISLKLAPPIPQLQTALLGMNTLEECLACLRELQCVADLYACEFFDFACVNRVLNADLGEIHLPFESRFYLLVEWPQDCALTKQIPEKSVLAQTSKQQRMIWNLREWISESLRTDKPIKWDISIKHDSMAMLYQQVSQFLNTKHQAKAFWFGHLGEGNIHLNIMCQKSHENLEIESKINSIVLDLQGCPSAEHGIGSQKILVFENFLSKTHRSMMREIKKVFDPSNIMNPGKIFQN